MTARRRPLKLSWQQIHLRCRHRAAPVGRRPVDRRDDGLWIPLDPAGQPMAGPHEMCNRLGGACFHMRLEFRNVGAWAESQALVVDHHARAVRVGWCERAAVPGGAGGGPRRVMDALAYRPEPAELCWTFGGVPPVRRVRPGTVLELWTEDAFGGKVRGPDDLVSKVVEFRYHVSEHL